MERLPQKLAIGFKEQWMSVLNWLFIFRMRTAYPCGLYYTGQKYDNDTPLLVSCNFLLTVVLLFYTLKGMNVRILIIDTKGVNVWCSAGKGQFSAKTIIQELQKYTPDYIEPKPQIIIPKLALSGIQLADLRKKDIRPIIGPVYMNDLPAYLNTKLFIDRTMDRMRYDIWDRLYILVPSLIQFMKYFLWIGALFFILRILLGWMFPSLYFTYALSGILIYQIAFPLLPGRHFSSKAIFLSAVFTGMIIGVAFTGSVRLLDTLFTITLIWSTFIFFSLYYTGNSGVSNYSDVKQEIIRFLPISFLMAIVALGIYVYKEVAA